MKLPWVSRERFEDERRKMQRLEQEREDLLDRIVMLGGQRPLYAAALAEKPAKTLPAAAAAGEGRAVDQTGPARRRKTGLQLVQEGNLAARMRAKRGAEPVTALLAQEARSRVLHADPPRSAADVKAGAQADLAAAAEQGRRLADG